MTDSTAHDDASPTDGLSHLSASSTPVPQEPLASTLESFPNQNPERDYWIRFDCPEFTSICPITGQPDFGHITIDYVADTRCVESKSLKLYMFAYRNHGAFHEAVVNQIADDIITAVAPRQLKVRGEFRPRGGIAIHVEVAHP